ncbi:cupin domain-containing protein [Candidatus Nitrosacidococcus sp. I8]|uniref:cupin domain-containing protein n=1 Tax=Candidatus Nitrosacidococcus sp. I8 TaxID=2942908 RepID=UPI002226FA02|nr:cupin domain-containing protein [Candidatus Nitrosacidococcus sp. I8]CAH9016849.1 hypothetical protein NURINAE_00252 [Candidatus Nitrosacidococcus sp. I8]
MREVFTIFILGFITVVSAKEANHETLAINKLLTPILSGSTINEKEAQATMLELTYAPGASTPPHHHAGAGLIYVIEGDYKSKISNQPLKTYHQGEAFFEPAGSVHEISANASTEKPVKFLVIFFTEQNKTPLTTMEEPISNY